VNAADASSDLAAFGADSAGGKVNLADGDASPAGFDVGLANSNTVAAEVDMKTADSDTSPATSAATRPAARRSVPVGGRRGRVQWGSSRSRCGPGGEQTGECRVKTRRGRLPSETGPARPCCG
jgi:hypothetical protein